MMDDRRWLILDATYLAHRAKYAFGELSYKGSATGVVYGMLNDLLVLMRKFKTSRLVFCWDSRYRKRQEMYPEYKMNRPKKEYTEAEQQFEKAFRLQMALLQKEYLPTIGFRNIFRQKGYEADDLVASVCSALAPDLEEGVIISADNDLYQLIRPHISFHNPQKHETITLQKFKHEYGISPKTWVKVKAIAGCPGDNVKGVPGVGPKTALSFVKGELRVDTVKYDNIKKYWRDIVLRNRPLVELPLAGTKTPALEIDELSQAGWNKVTKRLGMKSIRYEKIV